MTLYSFLINTIRFADSVSFAHIFFFLIPTFALKLLKLKVFFLFLFFSSPFSISKDLLTAVKKHFLTNGAAERRKQKSGRNKRCLTTADVERIVLFIRSHAETHGLVMPGRMKAFSRTDLKLLPSSHTKVFVYEQYRSVQLAAGLFVSKAKLL